MTEPLPRDPQAGRGRQVVILAAALAAAALAVALGFWQLDRARQKIALERALVSRAKAPPLAAAALARTGPAAVEAQHFRRVALSGRWDPRHTLYLDNRQMDGRVGFFVVTPLLLEHSRDAVLVQRGFAPRHFEDRAATPVVATPAGTVDVEGFVAPTTSRLFEFDAAASGPIRQNVDPASYGRETGLVLLPLAVLETTTPANAGDGLARHWPPPTTDVQTNYGYAFQWFAIAATIAFLYVRHRVLRHRANRRV